MKLPKRLDLKLDLEIDLWKIRPGVYIDLRPFPYGTAEEAYVYAPSLKEVYVAPTEVGERIDDLGALRVFRDVNAAGRSCFGFSRTCSCYSDSLTVDKL
jgi:hypothetical protein